ncbi:MAG: hypothetical protein HOP13_00260 [Alphaproteobacteria bacterium]|jgi:hypothetical protein|nr:hypothetical protein [Alphaproteobacteria bacterium]
MRFSIAALVVTAVAFALPAQSAEPPITNPQKIIDNATPETFAEIVRELGGQNVEIKREGDYTGIVFMDGNVPYNIGFTFCKVVPGKCLIASILVLVDNGKGGYPLETLNKQNKDFGFLTLYRDDPTKFGAGRLILVDGGVTKKNVAMEIALFVQSFRTTMKDLESQLIASAPGPFQRASYGPTRFRPLVVSPRYLSEATEKMAKHYKTDLRR